MKVKTINKQLCQVFDEFLKSIEDGTVRDLVKDNTIITGGSIASMLLGEPVNDYDMYFTTKETLRAVMVYMAKVFKKHNKHILELVVKEDGDRLMFHIRDGIKMGNKPKGNKKYFPIAVTSNSITLTGDVQLVTRFYGPVEEIHKTYDFAHVRNYWSSSKRKVFLDAEALECLLTKELRYKGSLYPLCSIIRTKKFLKRGFTCNAGQYLKMVMQLNELDLTNRDVLEDQLTGVDVAYFTAFIKGIDEMRKKDPDFVVDASYVVSVIDDIFNDDFDEEEIEKPSGSGTITLSNGKTFTTDDVKTDEELS